MKAAKQREPEETSMWERLSCVVLVGAPACATIKSTTTYSQSLVTRRESSERHGGHVRPGRVTTLQRLLVMFNGRRY